MMGRLNLDKDRTLYYETIPGNPALPVLIFLHEGLGCTAMWDGFAKQLCEKTRCPGLIYDRQGYGRSSALTTPRTIRYLHDYANDELPQVIDMGIGDHPYLLIGHSDGGSIALIHGARKPPHLRGIITEAAHVFVEPVTLEGIRRATHAFARGKLKGLYKFHGDKTEQIFYAWSDTWLSPEFKFWNIEDLLPDIEIPLLVIQGEDDQYGTIKQVDAICSQVSGNAASAMIETCGHAPHSDQPDKVIAAMATFIQSVL